MKNPVSLYRLCAVQLLGWLLACFSMTANAENATASAEGAAPADIATASPDTVVVTFTRTPTPVDEVAGSISVVTAEQIEARQERTLPEVLRDLPGLNLVQAGGPGGQTAIFMRGTNLNHTKVLVDGIDVSDPSNPNGAFDFGQFLTQDIERVEVLRGPQSGLYGSDAIGGVINIITKAGTGPARLAATVEGGSFDTFNQSASLGGSADALHYTANLEHLHTGNTPVTPLDLLPPGEARNDDYYDNLTASSKLKYDITQNLDVGLVARYTDSHLRLTGDDFSTFPSHPAAQQSANNTVEEYARAAAHAVLLAGFLDQTLGFAYTRSRFSAFTPDSPTEIYVGQRRKADWQGALNFSTAEVVVLGAEYERDTITQPVSAAINISSGYAELQSHLTPHLFSALNVRYDSNTRFGGKTTFRVAPAYVIAATGTKLKASAGSGFKAPTLSELFEDFPPFFFANPHLKAESSTGFDAGVEQPIAGNSLRAGVTYFHNSIRDLITTDASGITYGNVGRATTQGIESSLSWQALDALSVQLDYTYTEATDDILHQELLRRPKHKASLTTQWKVTASARLTASVLRVGPWVDGNRDFSIPRLEAPGYTVLNLAGDFDISRRLRLFARIDNLLNRHYENPVGFLQPSRGAFAGIELRL